MPTKKLSALAVPTLLPGTGETDQPPDANCPIRFQLTTRKAPYAAQPSALRGFCGNFIFVLKREPRTV